MRVVLARIGILLGVLVIEGCSTKDFQLSSGNPCEIGSVCTAHAGDIIYYESHYYGSDLTAVWFKGMYREKEIAILEYWSFSPDRVVLKEVRELHVRPKKGMRYEIGSTCIKFLGHTDSSISYVVRSTSWRPGSYREFRYHFDAHRKRFSDTFFVHVEERLGPDQIRVKGEATKEAFDEIFVAMYFTEGFDTILEKSSPIGGDLDRVRFEIRFDIRREFD